MTAEDNAARLLQDLTGDQLDALYGLLLSIEPVAKNTRLNLGAIVAEIRSLPQSGLRALIGVLEKAGIQPVRSTNQARPVHQPKIKRQNTSRATGGAQRVERAAPPHTKTKPKPSPARAGGRQSGAKAQSTKPGLTIPLVIGCHADNRRWIGHEFRSGGS